MTAYSPECFKLRCMNVNWRLSQMALETAALCISRPLFQDLSQRKRITSRTPKNDSAMIRPQRFLSGKRMGSTYWFDNIYQYFTCTSCQWQRICFSTFPGFHIVFSMSFLCSHIITPSWNLEDRTTTTSGRTRFKAWRSWCLGNGMLRWGNKERWYLYSCGYTRFGLKRETDGKPFQESETSISLLKALLEVEHKYTSIDSWNKDQTGPTINIIPLQAAPFIFVNLLLPLTNSATTTTTTTPTTVPGATEAATTATAERTNSDRNNNNNNNNNTDNQNKDFADVVSITINQQIMSIGGNDQAKTW